MSQYNVIVIGSVVEKDFFPFSNPQELRVLGL